MKIERVEGNQERQILTTMIVDDVALGRIAAKWEERDMFRSTWANVVGDWCVKYHNRYGKAPAKAIQGLFETWAQASKDKDSVALVDKFLVGLSGEYESLAKDSNSDYIVDVAAKHFTANKMRKAIEQIQYDLDDGKIDQATERWDGFNAVEMGTGAAVDVFNDMEAVARAFEEADEDLIVYPGALGHFFKGQLGHDAFVTILAPEKRGKSFWLMDAGWRAALSRQRVAWFSAGDMSERQMMRRIASRAARHPTKAKEWPCLVKVPTAIRRVEGVVQIKTEERKFDRPLDWRETWKKLQEIANDRIKSTKPYFKLASYPNGTLSVKEIEATLERWERQEDWVAKVVIVDYMDILNENASLPGVSDKRHKINATWMDMRALSQRRHCLVLSATQSDTEGGTIGTLRRGNFSEDKRKLAHVTGMVGVNQTEVEKTLGVYRLNWVVLREGEYSESATVAVAGSLPLGNPAVKSCW